MKKYLILLFMMIGFTFTANAQTVVDPLDQVYYRFESSLQPNKHYLEIINKSPQTVTFQSVGEGNYLTTHDGTMITLAEPGSDISHEPAVIAPGEKKTMAFYIMDANLKEAKTITFTGSLGGKTFTVNYDILTKEISVKDQ